MLLVSPSTGRTMREVSTSSIALDETGSYKRQSSERTLLEVLTLAGPSSQAPTRTVSLHPLRTRRTNRVVFLLGITSEAPNAIRVQTLLRQTTSFLLIMRSSSLCLVQANLPLGVARNVDLEALLESASVNEKLPLFFSLLLPHAFN